MLDRHSEVFKEELGHIKGAPATLLIDPTQQPRFYKACPVPYALRSKVETELSWLEGQGVIEPVTFSDWAAPIMPVVKRDGTVQICGDYKLAVNTVAKTDSYPLPRIDAKKLTTINTHKGLFQYNRLPFGVASAPAIFQRTMGQPPPGPPQCVCLSG